MFKIAVCDDSPLMCELISDMLSRHKRAAELSVTVYVSGTELYECLLEGKFFDLIILDIMIPQHNGLQIGRLLREHLTDNLTQILYMSSEPDYAMRLFDMRPLNFLTKPIQAKKLLACVDKAMELHQVQGGYFTFTNKKVVIRVPFREIRYFEGDNKQVLIHTEREVFSSYQKLRDVDASPDFMRIHKSYLVNDTYVKVFRYDSVTLVDGTVLPISYTYRKEVRAALAEKLSVFGL